MTTPTNDNSEVMDRYGNLATAVDELRGAWTQAGPDEDVHDDALLRIHEDFPGFAMRMGRLVALRADNDTSDVEADSPVGKLVQKLCDDEGTKVVRVLQEIHADRILAALVSLGISARLNGVSKWKPAKSAANEAGVDTQGVEEHVSKSS